MHIIGIAHGIACTHECSVAALPAQAQKPQEPAMAACALCHDYGLPKAWIDALLINRATAGEAASN